MKKLFLILFLGLTFTLTLKAQIPVFNSSGFDMEVTFNSQTHYLGVNEMILMPKNQNLTLEWKFKTDFELTYDSVPAMVIPQRVNQNTFKANVVLQSGKFSFKKPKIIRA